MTPDVAADGRARVVIENVRPEIDGGAYAIKRTIGETVRVEADIFADGHDVLACLLLYRHEDSRQWQSVRMQPLGNDRWRAEFAVEALGVHLYTIEAWVDRFLSWRHDLKRRDDPADVAIALQVGATIVSAAAARADTPGRVALTEYARRLAEAPGPEAGRRAGFEAELEHLMARHGEHQFATRYPRALPVRVDPLRARFSAWYEFFPRSAWGDTDGHGSLKDCEARLDYVAAMGFDVLYLPPIHPIGRSFRKGRNNARTAGAEDPGRDRKSVV